MTRIRLGSRALSIAILTASVVAPDPARALSCWLSDETGFDFHDPVYTRSETIHIAGDWDVFDFPCPVGDIYLVPNDSTYWTTRPIEDYVTRKLVQGCYGAGAFYGATLKLPPLPVGEYDIVMDEDEDGVYDAGRDLVFGDGPGAALEVFDSTLDGMVDVTAIKARALEQAEHWYAVEADLRVGFLALGLVSSGLEALHLSAEIGHSGVATTFFAVWQLDAFEVVATSYNGVSLGLADRLFQRTANASARVYADLAADPPDPDYAARVALAPVERLAASASPTSVTAVERLAVDLSIQAAAGEAFRVAYERFLGAEADQNHAYVRAQAEQAREYSGLLLDVLDDIASDLDSLEAALDTQGWLDTPVCADCARAIQQRLSTSGLSAVEIAVLAEAGVGVAGMDSLVAVVARLDLAALEDGTFRERLDDARAATLDARADHQAVAAELDALIADLVGVWVGDPHAVIGGASGGMAGQGIALDARGSSAWDDGPLAFAWDLDGDGAFDDASADSIEFVATAPGRRVIGLLATDTAGRRDVAYAWLDVASANAPPRLLAASPAAVFVSVSPGSSTEFSVTADDLDGESLSIAWTVNGAPAGDGTAHAFVAGAPGMFEVVARVSDGSPLSPDLLHGWWVEVGGATGVSEPGGGRPRLRLQGANPVTGTVRLLLELGHARDAMVEVLDITGRRVAVLADRAMGEGQHTLAWDGRTPSGATTPPGVYLVRVRAGGAVGLVRVVRLE